MEIFLERENRKINIKFNGSAAELLKKLNLNQSAVLVSRGKVLITEDTKLSDSDSVKIMSVVSGG